MSLRRFDTAELAVLLRSAAAARPARSLALAAVTSTVASVALALFHRRRQKRLLLCGLTKEAIVGMRRRLFCAAQSVSYANTEPLLAVRGRGARLIDEEGREFLDTRNNVGHVGHSHPDVVAAVGRQAALLNSNSRYLHPLRVRLAERLLATFPPELCKVFFVNSGSEANDLALRLARAHTGVRDVVVLDRAYHGHTSATIEISPYKFEHEGGPGRPPHVHKACCPDMYRGAHARRLDAAAEYANDVAAACARAPGGRVGAFFVESGMSVAGVVLPPVGYLRAAYAHARAAGAVCVADEVQVGFGRLGEHFWGFEQQGVVPDVVTMGKPFGNGFPLAAVVCRAEIAASFHNGLEYFNTFGGNPVACAAGLAVLDILEREGLQWRAAAVGAHLRRRLQQLADDPSAGRLLGEVRGAGLFIGVELVRDRQTREPATAETSLVCSRLKAHHNILTSVDGPHDSVIVIKPPLCFSEKDADRFVDALRAVLAAMATLGETGLGGVERTPT